MKTNSIPHTACFIRIQINVSLSRQARRKDVTIFGDTEAVRTAGPPRTPEQARPCAQAAAVAAVAARGSLVPVCPASRQHRGGQRPRPRSCPRGPVPAVPAPRSHPASAAHLHARHPDPVPAHRLAAFGVAPRSTPSSAPARGRRSRRLLSRNCHTNCPLAGVHRGPPAPVRHSKESYPDAGAPPPVALHSPPPRTVTRALQTPMRASVNFPRPQVHARPQARASVRGGGAEPRTQDSTRWAGTPPRRYTPSPTGLPLTRIISMLSITMPANGAFNPVLTRKGSLTYEFSPLKTSLHLNESNSCALELEIYFILFF